MHVNFDHVKITGREAIIRKYMFLLVFLNYLSADNNLRA